MHRFFPDTVSSLGLGWGRGVAVRALPLREDFAEGDRARWKVRPKDRVQGDGEGVTWRCAVDEDISNRRRDCDQPWLGGRYRKATAPPVVHRNRLEGDVAWDVTADVLAGQSAWLIKKVNESRSGKIIYYSREGAIAAGNPDLAPRLILELDGG